MDNILDGKYGSNGSGSTAPQNRNPRAQAQAQAPVSTSAPASADSRADNVLLQDIQLLMLQKQQAIILNPSDQASVKQVDILQQFIAVIITA
ncbi:hypothetical protein BGX26_012557 [Mortierella sp. AD094]|nr:hypothetical protein BGX26_012557 [Mortierella sp. AD094]